MNRFKKWIKDHPEESALTAIYGTVIALVVTAVVFDAKDEKKRMNVYNNWVQDEHSKGRSVFLNENGTAISVPANDVIVYT